MINPKENGYGRITGPYIRKTLLHSPIDGRNVGNLLAMACQLGPRVDPPLLGELRPFNEKALATLEAVYRLRQPSVEQGKIAVIIPAYRERGIGGILQDATTQLNEMRQQGNILFAEIIVAINGEKEDGETTQAVRAFLHTEPFLAEGISLRILSAERQGKLVAINSALTDLENQETFPEKIIFLDADVRIDAGCLKAMLGLLDKASATGATIVYQEPVHPYEAIAQLQTKGHGPNTPGRNWLHGGAYALTAELTPLYRAYLTAFPGTVMNDVNWTRIMANREIPWELTDKPYLILETPRTLVGLFRQQDRWIHGLRQGFAFHPDPYRIAPTPDVLARGQLIEYLHQHFPNFPKITLQEFTQFVECYIGRGEAWQIPLFQLLTQVHRLEQPARVRIGREELTIGGQPPNPYIAKGWVPSRDYGNHT